MGARHVSVLPARLWCGTPLFALVCTLEGERFLAKTLWGQESGSIALQNVNMLTVKAITVGCRCLQSSCVKNAYYYNWKLWKLRRWNYAIHCFNFNTVLRMQIIVPKNDKMPSSCNIPNLTYLWSLKNVGRYRSKVIVRLFCLFAYSMKIW